MLQPSIPHDEAARLQSLRDFLILDTPPEERFDLLTTYACSQFDVPIALVTLVDENRQWFKSKCGLGATETSRDISFCGHAILQDTLLMIPDATKDTRFADNPLVTNEPRIRFYAGWPITVSSGYRVGTFCLIDRKPHLSLDSWEQDHLRLLAKVVAQEIEGIDASMAFLASQRQQRSPHATLP